MKNMFRGYYPPTKAEFKRLWDKALLVMDANVLLNLYDYSDDTRQSFLSLLDELATRLWLPHQVALEYHRHRLNRIGEAGQKYDNVLSKIGDMRAIHKGLESQKAHPFVSDKTLKKLDKLIAQLRQELEKKKQTVDAFVDRDRILADVSKLYRRRVGDPYDEEQLARTYLEADKRFNALMPPGYLDEHKSGNRRYGDVVLWFQILDKARTGKADIIFITAEKKEDWWQLVKSKARGPRLELLHEFRSKTKRLFYMYEPFEFMKLAREYLKQKVEDGAIEEVKSAGQVVIAPPATARPTSLLKNLLLQLGLPAAIRAAGMIPTPPIGLADLIRQEENFRALFETQELLRSSRPPEAIESDDSTDEHPPSEGNDDSADDADRSES